MSFTALNQDINKALLACGYQTPTPIQAKAIPAILEGRDVVASSQTGSGKTAAFVLPALHRLSLQKPSKKTRILILTPTRELASQIMHAAKTYGKFLKFNIISLVGGMPYGPQIKDLSRGADIIIATPGRLMDHIDSQRVDLSHIEMLVLDEADRMLDMGFIEDVEYISKLVPLHRQTLLFSATVDNKLANVVRHLLKNPLRIDMSNEKTSTPQIKQELYKADNAQHKTRLLRHFLNDSAIYKAIIFSATKVNADKLATQLCNDGFSAAALHGDLRQNVRNRRIDELRRGKIQFLVATDVAARGIDIVDITHVINYDLPRFCEDYVHRIGRTGRAGKKGVAISFVLPTDRKHLQNIERFTGQRLQLIHHVELKARHQQENDEDILRHRERVAGKEISMPIETTRPVRFKKRLKDQERYQGEIKMRKGPKVNHVRPISNRQDEGKMSARFSKKRTSQDRWSAKKTDADMSSRNEYARGKSEYTRGEYTKNEQTRVDRIRPFKKRHTESKHKTNFSSHTSSKNQSTFKKRSRKSTNDRHSIIN